MTKSLLLQLQEQSAVHDFLDSIGRNSVKTKELYGFSLLHFQAFLSSDDRYSKFTANTILTSIKKPD